MWTPRSQSFSPQMNNRHLWQLKKIKILGAVLELPARHHCQSRQFNAKMGQMGSIGSDVQLVAPKRPPGF